MPNFLYSQLFVYPASPTRSFDGETVLITGANVGLGKEDARCFAQLGTSPRYFACYPGCAQFRGWRRSKEKYREVH